MKQIDVREGARRQDRAVALLTVIQCWVRGLDGVMFTREDLQRLLGLVRFKGTRVDWLREDFRDFFPHQQVSGSHESSSLGWFFVARKPFDLGQTGHVDKMLADATKAGVKMERFAIWPEPDSAKTLKAFEHAVPFFSDAANFDERLMTSYLALLSQGQISPKRLPQILGKKTDK